MVDDVVAAHGALPSDDVAIIRSKRDTIDAEKRAAIRWIRSRNILIKIADPIALFLLPQNNPKRY